MQDEYDGNHQTEHISAPVLSSELIFYFRQLFSHLILISLSLFHLHRYLLVQRALFSGGRQFPLCNQATLTGKKPGSKSHKPDGQSQTQAETSSLRMRLSQEEKDRLIETLEADTRFLCAHGLGEYNLRIGLHRLGQAPAEESFEVRSRNFKKCTTYSN